MVSNFRVIVMLNLVVFFTQPSLQEPQCDEVYFRTMSNRFGCGKNNADNAKDCTARGCCWNSDRSLELGPWCFYPKNYKSYQLQAGQLTDDGLILFYGKVHGSDYKDDFENLRVDIVYETENRLRVKISDAGKQSYEAPYPKFGKKNKVLDTSYKYDVELEENLQDSSFGFAVVRKFPRKILFDTRKMGGLIMASDYLQISAKVSSFNIYGFHGIFNRVDYNYYWSPSRFSSGPYSIYLGEEEDGKSHGVLLNHPMIDKIQIYTQRRPAITYRLWEGDNFEFYFLVCDSPDEVVHEISKLRENPSDWYKYPSKDWTTLFGDKYVHNC